MFDKEPVIHLGIAFDQNYLQHFYALFASIIATNKGNTIHVHSIITGVCAQEQQTIEQYARANGHWISFYKIDAAQVEQFVLANAWSSAVYYRIFFPLLVPKEVERLLYLDTDIIVLKDLTPLYKTDFDGYPLAAVYDNWVKTAPLIGIEEEGHYFNSGMMLINMPEWRRQKISEQAFAYLAEHPEKIIFVDQCGLNAVLINNWKKLDWCFNVMRSRVPDEMSKREKQEFLKDKVLIHYTLDRPWEMLCRNPYRYLYHAYLKGSPFKRESKYVDYSIRKLPRLIKIKLVDFYYDLPFLKNIWRGLKSIRN